MEIMNSSKVYANLQEVNFELYRRQLIPNEQTQEFLHTGMSGVAAAAAVVVAAAAIAAAAIAAAAIAAAAFPGGEDHDAYFVFFCRQADPRSS